MDMKSYTVKEARANISSIVDTVTTTGKTVLVIKNGKVLACIAPFYDKEILLLQQRKKVLEEVAGMWKGRNDLNRKQVRYDRIF